jgi:hypothetical protein
LRTFTREGEVQEGKVLLQMKATDRLRVRSAATEFPFRIERADLVSWLAELSPVVLIVYDARKEVAYWLYVQSYFRRREDFNLFAAGQTVTLRVPTANVVSTAAVRRFARFRDAVLAQTRKVIHDADATDPVR